MKIRPSYITSLLMGMLFGWVLGQTPIQTFGLAWWVLVFLFAFKPVIDIIANEVFSNDHL